MIERQLSQELQQQQQQWNEEQSIEHIKQLSQKFKKSEFAQVLQTFTSRLHQIYLLQ